jgi:hypothetical protein
LTNPKPELGLIVNPTEQPAMSTVYAIVDFLTAFDVANNVERFAATLNVSPIVIYGIVTAAVVRWIVKV